MSYLSPEHLHIAVPNTQYKRIILHISPRVSLLYHLLQAEVIFHGNVIDL